MHQVSYTHEFGRLHGGKLSCYFFPQTSIGAGNYRDRACEVNGRAGKVSCGTFEGGLPKEAHSEVVVGWIEG